MKVVVVGAGISGVLAGAHLRAAGIDVTVFERSAEAGGVWYVIFMLCCVLMCCVVLCFELD